MHKILEKMNLGVYRPFPRSMTRFLNENLGKKLVGAEIGVFEADHAKAMMDTLDMKKLYLVDPYESYVDYGVDDKNDYKVLIKARKTAERKMVPYGDKIEFIQTRSLDALDKIPEGLDFVYIDGNHEYEFVKQDIEAYYPKVRNGGVVGGHDIQNGFCSEHDGVLQAFVEFVNKKNLKPHIWVPDWWIIKDDFK